MRLEFDVTYIDSDGPEAFHQAIDELTTEWGARLNEIMIEEAQVRADGLGSAVDTGALTDSIFILEDEWDHVIVGTTIPYAEDLARGNPDPSTNLDDIRDWVRRKNLPPNMKKGYRKKSRAQERFARNVYNKMTTEGPIPNPFDIRAVDRFGDEWEQFIAGVYL